MDKIDVTTASISHIMSMLTKTMRKRKLPESYIAEFQADFCNQFGIPVPVEFCKPNTATNDEESIVLWVIEHTPPKRKEGVFYEYEKIVREALPGVVPSACGNLVRCALAPNLSKLYEDHKICVQLGVQSNGTRGIRIINGE